MGGLSPAPRFPAMHGRSRRLALQRALNRAGCCVRCPFAILHHTTPNTKQISFYGDGPCSRLQTPRQAVPATAAATAGGAVAPIPEGSALRITSLTCGAAPPTPAQANCRERTDRAIGPSLRGAIGRRPGAPSCAPPLFAPLLPNHTAMAVEQEARSVPPLPDARRRRWQARWHTLRPTPTSHPSPWNATRTPASVSTAVCVTPAATSTTRVPRSDAMALGTSWFRLSPWPSRLS